MQLVRVTGEANRDERRWEAMWSYRAQPPARGSGKNRTVISFNEFLVSLGMAEAVEPEVPEISDEEIEQLMAMGRVGLRPPGV